MYVWSSAWNSSAPTERIFTKFGIWGLIENLSRKFKFHGNPTRITRTLHKVQFTFLIISHSVLLRMVHVSDRFIEKIKTHILCSVTFPGKSCRLWDNVEKYGTARQATNYIIRRMRITCYRTKATHTLRECNTTAFPRQQWLRERVWMLRLLLATRILSDLLICINMSTSLTYNIIANEKWDSLIRWAPRIIFLIIIVLKAFLLGPNN